jgi:hypothetical protein
MAALFVILFVLFFRDRLRAGPSEVLDSASTTPEAAGK